LFYYVGLFVKTNGKACQVSSTKGCGFSNLRAGQPVRQAYLIETASGNYWMQPAIHAQTILI